MADKPRTLIPQALQPAARNVYYRLFRFQLRVRCWLADRSAPVDDEGRPLPPALLRYRVSELLDRQSFVKIGQGCAQLIEQRLQSMGTDLAQSARVLDFGCGCGRTLRWLAAQFPEVEFHGADVDAEAIEWCQAHLTGARFARNDPNPPLPYPSGYFQAIYCFSVFTHLDEPMQDAWLAELNRVLAPAGVLLLTIHGEQAARVLDSHSRAALQQAGFLHLRSRKLKGILPDWYHTTWHTREYIVRRLERWFDDVHYEDVAGGDQAIVVARARALFSFHNSPPPER